MLVKLKDIATLINGRAYLMPDLQRKGKYRIVRVGNFSGKDEWFYSDMELESDKYCEKGDLLYKWACNFGPEIWKEEKVIYHYHIWKLVVNENLVNKSYLFYKLLVMTPYWLCSTNGSTMVHITKEIMENKVIDLPDLYSQTKIARILKSIDDQIVRNNEMVNKLQVLGQTIFNMHYGNLVNNYNGHMKDICSFPSGFSFSPTSYVESGKYNLITIKNVNGTFVDETKTDKLNTIPKKMKAYCNLSIGDILISLTGNVGRVSINTCEKNLLNQRVSKLVCDRKFLFYLYNLLNTKYYQDIILRMASGTSQKNLSPLDLERLKVHIPKDIDNFYNETSSIVDMLCKTNINTQCLMKIKDRLLPLLINCQLI